MFPAGFTSPQSISAINKAMSTSDYSCDEPNADTVTDVSVAALPLLSNGAIYAGIDEGFFEKHGLKLLVSPVSSPSALIAAVQGGTTDFAFTGTIGAFQAIDQGIPLTIVAPFAGIAPGYWDKMQAGEEGYEREVTALMVAPDSGIEDPGDLDGKVVAVMDAKGQGELATRNVIDLHGGDPDSVQYVVMGFADATNALMAGQVDAAFTTEPAMVPAEEAGYEIISWPTLETFHEGPTSAMISSNDFVLNNPDVVARFNCAITESTAFANENHDVIREVTAREQGVDPASLANAVVPYFYQTVDLEGFQRFLDVLESHGFVTSEIDLNEYIISAALNP